jgi:NAD+ synthase
MDSIETSIKNIRGELKNYLIGNKIQSLVIGVSGGIDSCLCVALAKPICEELDIPLIGRSLPITTNAPDELERAQLTGKAFCTDFKEANLANYFNALSDINFIKEHSSELVKLTPEELAEIEKGSKIRAGNIKARLRMIYLYNIASIHKGMVLSTDNYTELLLGFWTLHGDVGDYGMIQNLWKTEVYAMAEWIRDNECTWLEEETALDLTINALATDGLGVTNRGDLGQILPEWEGSSREGYKEVDRILQVWEDRFRLGEKQQKIIETEYSQNPVIQRHRGTAFKRTNPVNIPRAVILYGPSVR